jgi:hypothetical protein
VNRRYVTMAGGVAALTALMLSMLWVMRPPAIPSTGIASADDFVLPAAVPAPDPGAVDALLKHEIWPLPPSAYSRASEQQARSLEAKVDAGWKLTGTYKVGAHSFVLVRHGDKTPEAMKPGDSLPDGRRIVEIQEERIWVLAGGKRVPIDLRPK